MDKMCESSLAKEKEYLEEYLAKGLDVLQVTVITIEYMMQNGASSSEIEAFLVEQSERYMADIDENFTGIYGLVNGDYIDGIGWVPEEDYVPKEREWYIAAKKASGKPTIVSPYLDAQTNTIMISVSQMLYDNDSVISIDIVLNQIQIITQDINIDGMGYGFIIDREGLVVAHSDESEKGKNYVKDAEMKKLLSKIYNEKEKKFRTKIYDEECTVFVDTVMDDWFVTMIISNSKLYHDIRTILTYNIILCVVVFALTSFFCTVAFRKIRMHIKKVEESQRKLENMNEKMVTTIARTIDARDRYTNGHSQRVAKYAMELARRMGKTENEQKEIYYAALLHDVGKIHVPDAIIHKPSKLSEEEFAHIRLHPISGYYILKDIDEMDMIARGSRWHHERYDEDVLYQMKQKCDTTKNILIADGDSQATDIIEHILQNETEYIVHKSSSGKEALQILMKTPVELVLLDIRLPDTDGFELCREIQKTWQIPIVFMIEDKNFDTIERAAAMGIKDYLSKPVTPLTLLEVIRSIL